MKAYNVTWSYKDNDEYPAIQPVIANSVEDAEQKVFRALSVEGESFFIYDVILVSEGK